jgi:inorganic pyrophosphatase
VVIECENHSFSEIKHIEGLGKQFQRELEEFFANYHGRAARSSEASQ